MDIVRFVFRYDGAAACPVHDGTATDFAATDSTGITTQLRPYRYMTSQLDTTYTFCIQNWEVVATPPGR